MTRNQRALCEALTTSWQSRGRLVARMADLGVETNPNGFNRTMGSLRRAGLVVQATINGRNVYRLPSTDGD
jgi:hypothetical protein